MPHPHSGGGAFFLFVAGILAERSELSGIFFTEPMDVSPSKQGTRGGCVNILFRYQCGGGQRAMNNLFVGHHRSIAFWPGLACPHIMSEASTDTTAEPIGTVELNGTECVVIPKEDYEGLKEDVKEEVKEEVRQERKEDITEYKRFAGSEFADVRARLSDLEEGGTPSSPSEPTIEGEETGTQDDLTPLEQIIGLPYSMAQNHLSEVDKRARFIAMHIEDLGSETQKGHSIDSSIVRTALTQSELVKGRAHTEQVRRVMDALEDLGGDEVSSNIKQGKRRMALSYEMVERINNGCCDDVQPDTLPDTVMIVG